MGDLCEIGNNCIIMPNAKIGKWCILDEGTLIPEGMVVPDDSVVVGRPGRIIRTLTSSDREMIKRMRGGDIFLVDDAPMTIKTSLKKETFMGKLYSFQGKTPQIGKNCYLFDSAEITGDVLIGDNCIIGAGVKIIGDSHGPVRIGNSVQIMGITDFSLRFTQENLRQSADDRNDKKEGFRSSTNYHQKIFDMIKMQDEMGAFEVMKGPFRNRRAGFNDVD